MKRHLFSHRMISVSVLSILFLAGAVQAQEQPATEAPPAPKEEGISMPRKSVGIGVLAFLIGWMIWRNNSSHQNDGDQDQ